MTPHIRDAGPTTVEPNIHSTQIAVDKHIEIQGEGRYTAHSFEPNMKIKIYEHSTHPIDFVALSDIAEVTLLTPVVGLS